MGEDLTLHEYQDKVVERMIYQHFLALFLDPGLGKTAISLWAFRELFRAVDVSRMLVVAPLRVCYSVWPREIAKWNQFSSDFGVEILHGPNRTERALRSDAQVLVINPEGLPWLEEQKWHIPEMLVVDESTRFKRKSAQRSKRLAKMLPSFGRRYALTGTPAPNGLLDLHGQLFLVDLGKSLGENIGDYKADYFVPVPCGPTQHFKWQPRTGSKQKIYDRIAPWVVRLDARDYLELPEKILTEIPVSLPPRAKERYEALRRDMVLRLEEGDVVAMNAGSVTGKCRQIANGSVYLNDLGEIHYDRGKGYGHTKRRSAVIHTAKAEALAGLVEELSGQPLLIGFEFRHERDVIRKALKPIVGSVPSLDGESSGREGALLERQWNAGELPVLMAHPQTAAHGLNLQDGGNHLCWYSIPWDLELHDQMVGRVWRQGQEKRTFVYYLVAEDTIDLTVTRTLKRKARDQDDLLNALREDMR